MQETQKNEANDLFGDNSSKSKITRCTSQCLERSLHLSQEEQICIEQCIKREKSFLPQLLIL